MPSTVGIGGSLGGPRDASHWPPRAQGAPRPPLAHGLLAIEGTVAPKGTSTAASARAASP
uniref:Uncharacterized protein n=1 Tax=Setaria italica TaxID=4555 RepID=K4AN88_SETIT